MLPLWSHLDNLNQTARNDHWKFLFKIQVFYADRKSKMATTAGNRLTLDPMGKCSNAFFSKTTNMIKATLYMNVPWMGLYKLGFLFRCEIRNDGYGRTWFNIGPYGIKFQYASLKPLGQLKPNCPGIIIWRSSKKFGFFMSIRNPRWLPPQDID